MVVEDLDGENLTGSEARKARKQRKEAAEAARLARLSQKVSARRWTDDVEVVAEKKQDRVRCMGVRRAKEPSADVAAVKAADGGKTCPQVTAASVEPEVAVIHKRARRTEEEKKERKEEKEKAKEKDNKQDEEKDKAKLQTGDREDRKEKKKEKGQEKKQKKRRKSPYKPPVLPPSLADAALAAVEMPVGLHARRSRSRSSRRQRRSHSSGSSTSSSSISSDTSSCSPSSASSSAMRLAKELSEGPAAASFSWERPFAIKPAAEMSLLPTRMCIGLPLATMTGAQASSADVETFLVTSLIDPDAAAKLRSMPPQLQKLVIERGPIVGTRNPSSVLIARMRDAEMGRLDNLTPWSGSSSALTPLMLKPCNDPEVEKLIKKHNLDARAAGMLRCLPVDERRRALALNLEDARNPSAFIITQLQGSGKLTQMSPFQPRDSSMEFASFGPRDGSKAVGPSVGTL
eukprot:TRINITY_DN54820_c0_g1_i1.p1 TRINITY_DN54820_c0_g1~~TRINITY_DN54820_c0_g1_i1.p1  ORF type:complete len:490 (-),score=114.01 TRINITY_DN54820_c0_g1_i1:156-1535(-)